jgi:HEAT repeat protein
MAGPLASLLEGLRSPDEAERARAARALGASGERAAVPALCAALDEAAPGEAAAALCAALGALGDPAAAPALTRALSRARSDLYRLPPLRALGGLGAAGIPELLAALKARDGSPLRAAAAAALGALGAEEAVGPLCEALATARDPSPFAAALLSLGRARPGARIGDRVLALAAFGEATPAGRAAAAGLIAALGAEGGDAVLDALSEADDPGVRSAARRARRRGQKP